MSGVFISTSAGSYAKPAIVDNETGLIIAVASSPADAERISDAINQGEIA